MKKINLIEMLQGCSKRNGTTFRQSNPDGQPTVNRQSTDGQSQRHYTLGLMKYAAMVTLLLTFACGNVWGAITAAHTVTPNLGGTQYEIYSLGTLFTNKDVKDAYTTWIEGSLTSNANTSSSDAYKNQTEWFNTNGTYGYGYGQITSKTPTTITFRVTNCTEVAVLSRSGGNYRGVTMSVKENGSDTELGTQCTSQVNSVTPLVYGTALDRTKTYNVFISAAHTSGNGGNVTIYQIRFKSPAAFSASLSGTTSNASATIGESAGTISCAVSNGTAASATSYQWYKTTSNKAAASSISGATSSTYSPNEASDGTYYYYCAVTPANQYTAASVAYTTKAESALSGAFVFSSGSTWKLKGSFDGWGDGYSMTGSGTVSVTRTLTASTKYEFKLTDGTNWYGNGHKFGGTETNTVSTNTENCYLMTSEAGSYKFDYNTSTNALTITYPNSYTFYYANSSSWSKVYVYKYTEVSSTTGNNANWPGEEIASPSYTCGGTNYYAATSDGYATLIFTNNGGSQTGNMAVSSSDAGKYVSGTGSSWTAFPTYTVTYNANGDGAGNATGTTGSVPTDSNNPYACGSTVTVLGKNTLAKDGYNFIGWNTAPGGGGTSYAADATFTISANTTLYAQWELIPTYDVIYNTNGGTGGSTASQTGNLSGAQVTTSANGFTKTGYKFKWWNTAANGSGEDFYPGEKVTIASADVNLYAQWEQVSDGWAYWVGDDASSSPTDIAGNGVTMRLARTADYNTDLTAASTTVNATGKHAKVFGIGADDKYVEISFTDGSPINSLTLGVATKDGSSPTIAVMYSTTSDFSSGEYYFAQPTVPTVAQTSKSTTSVNPDEANKYKYVRIYRKISTAVYEQTGGSGKTTRIYSIKAEKGVSCSTPAAPTDFTAGSISATGATFTITDAADAASYDIYYSTESTAPTSGTPATTTSTSKTKEITGLTAATTYYAWVRSVCDASHKSAWVALNPGGDTHTFATSCVAPATVNVTATVNEVSGYWFYPGDDVVLTAAPTGSPAGSPVTYQWKKNGSNVGTNSATLTINDAAASDAGKYTCTISYGACSTTSAEFSLKCMQFYLKNSGGGDISNHALVKEDATHATLSLSLTGGTTYKFRVTDGCNDWYGNTGEMTSSNCTDWRMNADADCRVTTNSTTGEYTFNFDFSEGILGTEMKVSVVYPGGDQAADKIIYWDNSVLNWAAGKQWYRIGKKTNNTKTQMTLVPGTANLYKVTTAEYNGFQNWHIANNQGEGTGNVFWTKDNSSSGLEITHAMAFEGTAVSTAAITVTPSAASPSQGTTSDNDNCYFYAYTKTNGMKTQNVAISPYSNGTITVNYTNTSGSAATLTSGNADLAHTVILTSITAVPNTGYDASAITINGGAYSTNYVVTGATTVAASFTPQVYNITYKDQGNVAFSGEHADGYPTTHTYGSSTVLKGATKTGYTFGGWYGNPECTGDALTSILGTSYTADFTLYAKWTAAASLTALVANTLYEVPDMVPTGTVLPTSGDAFVSGLSDNTKFMLIGTAGADEASSSVPKVNANSSNDKTIDDITFDDGSMWFKGNASLTSNIPTTFGLSFIVPEGGGKLYLYFSGTSTNIKLAKSGASGSKPSCTSGYGEVDVTAGTYYLYGTGTTAPYCFYGLKLCSKYNVSISTTNVTKTDGATGAGAAIHGKAYEATFTAPVGYTLPSDATVTIGGTPQTKGTGYTWTISDGTATLTVPAAYVTGNIVVSVAGVAAVTHDVTFSLTNVAYSSGDNQGTDAATEGSAFSTVFAASSGYSLPGTITVTIGGVAQTAGTGYTWAQGSGTLTIPAAYVTGDIVVTIAGEELEGDGCEELVHTQAASATTLNTTVGTATLNSPSSQSNTNKAVKLDSSGNIELSPKAGKSFAANDSIIVVLWNQASSEKTSGYKIGTTDYTESIPSRVNYTFRRKLAAADIVDGKVTLKRESSNGSNVYFVSIIIKHCEDMESCTTPTLPTLSNQTVCPGTDVDAWNATVTNASTISAAGESVAYSWKKKGSDSELATTASYDLGAATEGMAGTYVVTVTVSKTGYISKSASKEVTLTVTPATEEPSVSSNKATVYAGNSVTLTATCGSSGTITWAWYTCTNAAGDGESVIAGQTTSAYAIASAPAAGTYYYKVKATGDGTNACGTAEYVYTLTVSAASGTCNMMTIFDGSTMSSAPASTSGTESTSGATWSLVGTATEMSGTVSMEYSGKTYTKGWKFTGGATTTTSRYIQIVIPSGYTGDLVMNGFIGSTSRSVFVATSPTGTLNTSIAYWSPATTNTLATATTRLSAGTYYVCATNSAFLAELSVNVCGDQVCTDEKPTATATNNTVCSGSTLTITATGYESDPTSIQWQKKNGDIWEDIDGATSATYTVASAAAANAGTYRVQVTKGCTRNSNEVTIAVPSVPVFGTVPASVTVMQTIALSITTVEASNAASYKWYKSADATWDAGDAEICDTKNLLKAYEGEAIGNNAYYVFCRATNSCGTATSSAIAVNVIAFVSEDCAERGGEGETQFGFENTSCSQGTYSETAVWTTNSRSKYLTYTAPEGKYLKTAKVTVAVTSGSKCGYAYSTDGGTTWTYAELTSLSSTLTEKTINLNSLSGTINAFRIGRNLQDGSSKDWGVTSGNFHLSKACFEYTESCTATTVTPSTSSVDYTMGGAWSNHTFALAPAAVASETLTYTSSNEDIATVDDDGTVNFQGDAGTVTITASYAGGEVSSTQYCASSGSYTITVSCSDGAPKIFAASSVDLSGCNTSVTLEAKQSGGSAFASGTYQWYRDGETISGATSASYTAVQAGVYTVERTGAGGCTNLSSNSATVTSETVEPEIEHLAPFQYYHVDKTYSAQMKMRHLFTVKGSAAYGSTGKNFKMELSKNGAAATDVTTSNAFVVWQSTDKTVDTVMIDLNKLSGKYAEDDELVLTCKAVDCEGNVSTVYKDDITIHVIDATPTLALILDGKDSKVGGDFLEDYNPKNLQEQTDSKTWSGEWPMYTDLKTEYNVTPVNGYAPFNKLNYEPFDIIFMTDFPKASKSDATKALLDDMYELVDFRPMFSFKTHMLWKKPSKWASKGFTAEPVVPKDGDGRTKMNIVCYAHPMFEAISGNDGTETQRDASDPSQIVYKMLSGVGYEKSKGIQGFEMEAAENFVTIGLIHYNAGSTDGSPSAGQITWSPNAGDRMLVAACERQANPEARMILLSLNAGAHSKLTEKGRLVVMKSLEYLIQTSGGLIEPADCSYTFDNGEGYSDYDAATYSAAGLSGSMGDGKWSTEANWGPGRNALPGQFTSVRIAAPVEVDVEHAHVMETRIVEGGSITIPAGKGLEVTSTVRHMDGAAISPTEINELTLEASSSSNGTLIFNNNTGDSKATVWAYSKGFISEGVKNYQYIGTPFNELNALYNYYGSWIYRWDIKKNGNWGWVAVKNGGPMQAWAGYCITQETPTYYETSGTMTATGTVDIAVPAGNNMVVGNSWTAPIDINALTTDDLEGLVANIYFFNTGVDKEGTGGAAGSRYAGGTYVTVPVESARYTGDDDHINSMQGFFVKNRSGSDGVLHLDYDRHVRGTTRSSIIGDALHAPARRAASSSDEPTVLKIKVSGENYDDKLLLLEREDFTEGFDNGWDGDKWDGNASALYIYTTDSEGTENSVSAVPELEGTIIGFRAGEDDAYTLNFEYLNSDEPLYLYDVENNTYTQIMTGMTYRFFTTDNEKHARFIITRSNGQEVATGVEEPTSDSSLKGRARKLLIEDKMFIMVNGMLYDATGKVVK